MIDDLKINEALKKRWYDEGYWTHDTIADIWERTSAAHPDREYVCDDTGSRLTYGEVDDKSGRIAAWLIAKGVEVGDVVTLQFPTWAEFCIAYVAVLKVGGVVHPVPRNYNDVDLEYAMNLVGSRAFLSPTFSHNTDYEAQILSVRDAVPTLAAIAVLDKQAPSHSDLPTFDDIYRRFEPVLEPVAVSADSVACILPTSGTTGKPKQSMLTHNNILFSERAFTGELGRTEADVMFMPSPLNHATGFFHGLISPLLLGGRAVLQQDFRPREAIALMNAEGVTWSMSATPFIYDMLNVLDAEEGLAFDTLRLFCCGGAPLPPALIERAARYDVLLCEIYGSTESCPARVRPPEKCAEWDGACLACLSRASRSRSSTRWATRCPRAPKARDLTRAPHVRRLPERARPHRPRPHRRRLVFQRRPVLYGRGGAHPHQRAQEGGHHPRRREHLGPGDRRRPHRRAGVGEFPPPSACPTRASASASAPSSCPPIPQRLPPRTSSSPT